MDNDAHGNDLPGNDQPGDSQPDNDQQRDDELRDALQATAPAPPPTADELQSIVQRAQRGRVRALGVALVIALIAGPLVGVLVGFGLDDGGDPVTVASGNDTGAERFTADQPLAPPAGAGTVTGSASSSVGPFAGGPELVPLFVRTTADGVTMRTYRSDFPKADPGFPERMEELKCAPDAACPEIAPMPAHCMPSTTLQAALSNEGAVEPGFVSISELAPDSPFEVFGANFFGVRENSPAAWVVVRANDAAATVRVTFSDGGVDEMAPVQGFAVLAHQMAPPPQPATFEDPDAYRKASLPGGTVEVLDGAGAVIGSRDLSETSGMGKECMMPAPIPAPDLPMPQLPPGAGGAEPMPMPMPMPIPTPASPGANPNSGSEVAPSEPATTPAIPATRP